MPATSAGMTLIRSHSEVGRLRLRHRIFSELEKYLVVQVVLRAYRFDHRAVYFLPPRHSRPWRIERARIFNRHGRLDRVAAIDDLPAFHHVKVLGVRRAVIVDKTVRVLDEADGVDDKLAVLVTAYGLAEPPRPWIFAVLAVEIDPAHLLVPLPDDPDLLRRLNEVDGLGDEEQLARTAPRPAAGLRVEGAVAVAHQVVMHSH